MKIYSINQVFNLKSSDITTANNIRKISGVDYISEKNSDIISSYPKNYYLNQISFGFKSKLAANDLIAKIGEENFPSREIVKKLKKLGNSKDFSLYDVHIKHYKGLLDCSTLEEAKQKYPEFKDVIDAKNVDYNSQNKGSLIYRIGNNGTPNLDIKDLSLELLKKQYGQLISTQKREQYYNFKTTAIEGLFKLLNIKKMNKTYILCVFRSADEYKEKHLQSFQLPKTKENLKEAAKRRWENKESREQMEKWWEAQRLAWDRHPEITEQKTEIAKSYTGLAKILDKKRKKIPLTKGEKIYLKKYYKECERKMPNHIKIIEQEARNIYYNEWGLK